MLKLYQFKYADVKNLKIEFKDNNFFINCKTIRDLTGLILKYNGNFKVQDCSKLIKDLSHHIKSFNEYEATEKGRVGFCLSKLLTEEGVKVPGSHYSYQTKVNALKNDNVLFHATSNIHTTLTPTQTSAIPLPELIKPGSKAPGTIITEGNYRLIRYSVIKHVS